MPGEYDDPALDAEFAAIADMRRAARRDAETEARDAEDRKQPKPPRRRRKKASQTRG